jgi:hypothetical protein
VRKEGENDEKNTFNNNCAAVCMLPHNGYSFAIEQSEPASEQPKIEEKAPATDAINTQEKKRKDSRRVRKQKQDSKPNRHLQVYAPCRAHKQNKRHWTCGAFCYR